MKRMRSGIAFCMVLILLFAMVSCAKPSAPSSSQPSPSSSEVSSPSEAEPVIEPYAIAPLDVPMNGGMTYEEYFSVERELRISEGTTAEGDGNHYVTPYGTVITKEHEIFLEQDGERILLYRHPDRMWWYTVDENWIVWQQQPEGEMMTLYRLYLPTLHYERVYSSGALFGYSCLSSTDMRVMETRNSKINGKMRSITTIYSELTEQLYLVEFHHGDAGLREAYLGQRDHDMKYKGE